MIKIVFFFEEFFRHRSRRHARATRGPGRGRDADRYYLCARKLRVRAAAALSSNDVGVLLNAGHEAISRQDYQTARTAFTRALEIDPACVRASLLLGRLEAEVKSLPGSKP